MKQITTESEKAIQEAFILKEKGHSLPMITAIFPKYKEDIHTAFHMMAILRDNAELLSPDPRSLQKALAELGSQKDVQKTAPRSFLAPKPKAPKAAKIFLPGEQPAPSAFQASVQASFQAVGKAITPTSFKNVAWLWKIALPVVVLLVIVVGAIRYNSGGTPIAGSRASDIVSSYENYVSSEEQAMNGGDTTVNDFYNSLTSDPSADTDQNVQTI